MAIETNEGLTKEELMKALESIGWNKEMIDLMCQFYKTGYSHGYNDGTKKMLRTQGVANEFLKKYYKEMGVDCGA